MLELFQKKYPRFGAEIKPSTKRLVTERVEKDGVLVEVSNYKEVSFGDSYKQFKSQDFSITNLLAVGATNMLKPVTMSNHDVSAVADKFDNLAKSLEQNGNAE